jgi:hypothetical protein
MLMFAGGAIFLVGVALALAPHMPALGNLPGNIRIERPNFTLFLPCGTMLLASVVLTLLLNLLARWWR